MLNIQETIIPISAARPGKKLGAFKGVTIHETGNFSQGSGARNHSVYMNNGGKNNQVSYQYVVDDKEAYHLIPDNEVAWHAGDGATGKGNNNTIAIEICVNPDGDFKQARKNAAELTAKILKEHGITQVIDGTKDRTNGTVFQHNTFSSYGKNCPQTIRNTGLWDSFLEDVRAFLDGGSVSVAPTAPEAVEVKPYRVRLSADDAKSQLIACNTLQNAINVANANPGYSVYDKQGSIIHTGQNFADTLKVGDAVRVTGNVYATGQNIPAWVKNKAHVISQIREDDALLGANGGINSWVPLSGLIKG